MRTLCGLLIGALCLALAVPATVLAAPTRAVRAACAADAKRLCGSAANAMARQACMYQHRAEWSEKCKTAQSAAPKNAKPARGSAAWLARRERCATFVADFYRDKGNHAHTVTAPKALRRCMNGGPMYELNQ